MTCGRRRSPWKIFAYCSVVNFVIRSERLRSVNDTAISIRTGTTKKRAVRVIAGPRKITKLARLRAADLTWLRRSIVSSLVAAIVQSDPRQPLRAEALFDDHILERRGCLVDHEVRRLIRG